MRMRMLANITNITNQLYSQIVKRHIVIKNEDVTSCSNCLFFIKPTFKGESYSQFNLYGRCKQFGEKDIITGEVEQSFALACRKDRSLCGIEARHFIYNFGQNLGK